MPISWGQLPLEMRQAVVKEMTVGTRVNLSMCSKSDNQLVRGTKYGKLDCLFYDPSGLVIIYNNKRENKVWQWILVKPGKEGTSVDFGTAEHPSSWRRGVSENARYSTKADWKQTFMKIMSLIGTEITVQYLDFKTEKGFKKKFKWLRNNIHFNPKFVSIGVDSFTNRYDESIWDWPSHTKIHLSVRHCKLQNLENIYDRIVLLSYYGSREGDGSIMTDEELKKFRNAEDVTLYNCNVTIDGFLWWFKEWMARTNDKKDYFFLTSFKRGQEISFQTLANPLSAFIVKIDKCIDDLFDVPEEYWRIKIKKNEKAVGIIKLFKHEMQFKSKIIKA